MSNVDLTKLTDVRPVTDHIDGSSGADAVPAALRGLVHSYGGATLSRGFYRFHTSRTAVAASIGCARLIRGFAGRFFSFAFDWLDREIAVDVLDGNPDGRIILVDPGGGDHLTTPWRLSDWHDAVASGDDPLAYSFYEQWRDEHPHTGALGFDQVIGYKVPLFLGGEDHVAHLAVTDREVYLETCTAPASQVRDLPPGTPVAVVQARGGGVRLSR